MTYRDAQHSPDPYDDAVDDQEPDAVAGPIETVRAAARTAVDTLARLDERHVGVALAGFGLLAALWLLAGWLVGDGFALFFWALFGIGGPAVALALVLGGAALALSARFGWQERWGATAAGEVLFVALLALLHLALGNSLAAAQHGEGGGLVGWALARLLSNALGGAFPAGLVLVVLTVTATWWLWRSLPPSWTRTTLSVIIQLLRNMGINAAEPAPPPAPPHGRQAAGRSTRPRGAAGADAEPLPGQLPLPPVRTLGTSRPAGKQTDEPVDRAATEGQPLRAAGGRPAQAQRVSGQVPVAPAQAATPGQAQAGARTPKRRPRPASLPPMDLLDAGADAQGLRPRNADARQQAQILKQTLLEFGVPVEVVSIKEGPTVTQFGLEPGEVVRELSDGEVLRRRVSVNRIQRLSNDLALALAAPSIRIEAPVPGRPYVGVEVPNPRKTLVALRPVLETPEFGKAKSLLAVALGRDVSGDAVVADLARMPHLLIAGATGSGKSVCINALVVSLLMNNGPETLRFIMIDPKMVELPAYNGIPHLVAPVVTDPSQATGALAWLTLQMDERYRTFSANGVRNIEEYNRRQGKGRNAEPLPYIVLVIDELADLMMVSAYDVERQICRLAQMARATGIHLVLATQRPSVDVITGLIKANFPARVAFAVTSQIDSRVILDTPGAEKLLGRGDMLFMAPESSKLQRVQGCYVSDQEIDRLGGFWRSARPEDVQEAEPAAPWAGLLEQQAENHDEMIERAIDIARGKDYISTSLLQRQLRIGYPRAARIMEQLEEMGVVGPDEGGGRSREVLLDEDDVTYEADEEVE